MNNEQARNLVRQTLTEGFDKTRFRNFALELLNKFDESKAFTSNKPYIKDAFKNHVERFERLGTYTSPDDEKLDVLIVHLTKESKLERARTAIRNFVADHLKQRDGKDAALVAFVSPSEKQWRFSYVKMEYATVEKDSGKIGVETKLTPARRFSYIVGEGESCHTAQTRFLDLLQDTETAPTLGQVEDAFSVEAVTREFFSKYAELFKPIDKALEKLTKNDPAIAKEFEKKNVRTADFAKKLMGQVVFLYFIQKKGWLGVEKEKDWGTGPHDFLRRLARGEYGRYDNFFNDVLEPLFYDTLATDRGHEAWCNRFNCRIPFLNGGLFEPLSDYNWRKTDIVLPNRLFTNDERVDDFTTGSGLLDMFDRYNFTVNEAEPLEKEVAIDPEMLGQVFENLIEENLRKGLGSYYTPREIVHYMCQESLINYLDTALNSAAEAIGREKRKQAEFDDERSEQTLLTARARDEIVPRVEIETFVHLGDQISHYESVETRYAIKMPKSIEKHARLIDEKLADITICDPAVGSGAFPVGMMSEVVRARSALTPYFNDIHDRTPYHFKRQAIQNCLYGVDIDPGAVEIAKLRLWLSLVVDEEDVKQIKPLPNLFYKIVTGNSLFGVEKTLFNEKLFRRLEELKPLYFDEADQNKKHHYKQQIDDIIHELTNGKETFDFEIYFSEVFHRKEGFDVVIANPPYVQITKDRFPKYEIGAFKRFEAFCYKADLYELFLERTVVLLNPNGVACYITPIVWLTLQNSERLRRLLLRTTSIIQIRIWGDGMFENAVVSTQTIFFTKSKSDGPIKVRTDSGEKLIAPKTIRERPYSRIDFQGGSDDEELLKKIEDSSQPLGKLCEVSQGITPYDKYRGHDARLISRRDFHANERRDKTYGRWLNGRDVTRYKIEWRGEWLSYGDWLGAPREARFFTSDKLLCREVPGPGKRIQAAFHTGTIYCGHAISPVIARPNKRVKLKFVLGVINSTAASWYAGLRCPNFAKDVFPKLNPSDIKQLPIPNATSEKQEALERLVDRVLTARRRDPEADTSALERQIDQLVYALNGLTSAEIEIVEGGSIAKTSR